MGMYTGLRFKGVVKEKFRREFKSIAIDGEWENSKDDVIRAFSDVSRCSFIPCGALAYMPDEWEDENGKATDGFDTAYNEETGFWTFQCSLKDYDDTIEEFFKLVPYFIETVEHAEVFYEEWVWSYRYDLLDDKMVMTNHEFIKYGYE